MSVGELARICQPDPQIECTGASVLPQPLNVATGEPRSFWKSRACPSVPVKSHIADRRSAKPRRKKMAQRTPRRLAGQQAAEEIPARTEKRNQSVANGPGIVTGAALERWRRNLPLQRVPGRKTLSSPPRTSSLPRSHAARGSGAVSPAFAADATARNRWRKAKAGRAPAPEGSDCPERSPGSGRPAAILESCEG